MCRFLAFNFLRVSVLTVVLSGCYYEQPYQYSDNRSSYSHPAPGPATRSLASRASTILDQKISANIGPRVYLGKCGFSDDLKFAKIWMDEMAWYAIVTNKDQDMKREYMTYFFNMTRLAAKEVSGSAPQPYFHVVTNDDEVMARGVIVNGQQMPNFVEPKYWKQW